MAWLPFVVVVVVVVTLLWRGVYGFQYE